ATSAGSSGGGAPYAGAASPCRRVGTASRLTGGRLPCMPAPAHIVLIGMMGSGKTRVGIALAARLGVPYADNDEELQARTGLDAAALARERGVAALHAIEDEILDAALHRD